MHPLCLGEAQGLNTSQESPTIIPVGQRGHRRRDCSSNINVPYTASYLQIGGTYVTARLHCCLEGAQEKHSWDAASRESKAVHPSLRSQSHGFFHLHLWWQEMCLTGCRKHCSVCRVISARRKRATSLDPTHHSTANTRSIQLHQSLINTFSSWTVISLPGGDWDTK